MNEYTKMAVYYDTLMTSGYYNYDAIADSLERYIGPEDRVLEVGVGTGLVAEKLSSRLPDCDFTGVDHTQAMLDIAHDRVGDWCTLVQADVATMALGQTYDVILSCGGVWALLDAETEWQLCTHIPDDAADHAAFGNVMNHIKPGGLMLLSVQGTHKDYEKALPGDVHYRQSVTWNGTVFEKEYAFDGPQGCVLQHNTFRIRHQSDMNDFLCRHGLVAIPERCDGEFHAYRKESSTVFAGSENNG